MFKLVRAYKYYLVVPALLLVAFMILLYFAEGEQAVFRYFGN